MAKIWNMCDILSNTIGKPAGIEGTLSQGVRAFGLRRSRYIGLAKTPLQHILIAVAMNLRRVMAWLTNPHPTKPRVSPFAALASPF